MSDEFVIVARNPVDDERRIGRVIDAASAKRYVVDWGDGKTEDVELGRDYEKVEVRSVRYLSLTEPDKIQRAIEAEPVRVVAGLVFDKKPFAVSLEDLQGQLAQLPVDDGVAKKALGRAKAKLDAISDIAVKGTGRGKRFKWTGADSHPLLDPATLVAATTAVGDAEAAANALPAENEAPPAAVCEGPEEDSAVSDGGVTAESEINERPRRPRNDDDWSQVFAALGREEEPLLRKAAAVGALVRLIESKAVEDFAAERVITRALVDRNVVPSETEFWVRALELGRNWRPSTRERLLLHLAKLLRNVHVEAERFASRLASATRDLDIVDSVQKRELMLALAARSADSLMSGVWWSAPERASDDERLESAIRRSPEAQRLAASTALAAAQSSAGVARLMVLPSAIRTALSARDVVASLRRLAERDQAVARWLDELSQRDRLSVLEQEVREAQREAAAAKAEAQERSATVAELTAQIDRLRDLLDQAAESHRDREARDELRIRMQAMRTIARVLTEIEVSAGALSKQELHARAQRIATEADIETVSAPGARVLFDPVRHESPEPIAPGEDAVVVRTGYAWAHDSAVVLTKVLVTKVSDHE